MGWIAVNREIFDHEMFENEPHNRRSAWIRLISYACWQPKKVRIAGQVVQLQRGQLSYSVRYLAEAWGWKKNAVERFLDGLKKETMIRTERGTGGLVITICNYNKYQDVDDTRPDKNRTQTGHKPDK